ALDETMLVAGRFGEAVERADGSSVARLPDDRTRGLAEGGRSDFENALLVDLLVPDFEIAHEGVATDVLAVGSHDGPRCAFGIGLVAAHETRDDGGARGQSLEVPLPWSGVNLVEVVDGKDEVALGRAEDPEIGDVHIAARHHG